MRYRPHSVDDQLRKREAELDSARWTIVDLMPEAIRELLIMFYECNTFADRIRWERDTAAKLIAFAEAKPAEEMGSYASFSDRAVCPLCRGDSRDWHGARGFTVPDGLLRHFLGTSNAIPCRVFEAVRALAKETVDSKEEREREAQAQASKRVQRVNWRDTRKRR